MESTDEPPDPRSHLSMLDAAVDSVTRRAVPPTPRWFWPVISLLGPAIVAYETQTGARRVVLLAVTVVPMVVALLSQVNVRSRVKPRRVPPTAKRFKTFFPFFFVFIASLNVTSQLADTVGQPLLLACAVYVWLAVSLSWLWSRHEATLAAEAAQSALVP